MNRIYVTLNTDGSVACIGETAASVIPLANARRRRLSHIVPVNPIKRAAFRLLRFAFGDSGRVSGQTRTWAGPWRATIIATKQTATFNTRAEAIDWELETLCGPKFDL